MTIYQHPPLNQQRGAVTIVISIVMLLLVTMVVLTTSKTVLMEQKIANNMLRSEQSLEASETGIQEALSWLTTTSDWDDIVSGYAAGDAFNIFDTDANGTVDSNTGTLPDGSSYTLLLGANSDLGAEPMVIEIESTGLSDDGLATRIINRLIKFIEPVPFPLDNPILSGGAATVTGNAARIWNPQGHSTIWSGGNVNIGDNTNIADPDDPDYPECMETPMTCDLVTSSTDVLTGLDIVEQDSSLAALTDDEFFENFFGMSKTEYKNTLVTLEVDEDNVADEWDDDPPGVSHAQKEIIWVNAGTTPSTTATLAGSRVSGCATSNTANNTYGDAVCIESERKPSIIIIEGDLKVSGTFNHYGIIYVTGNISVTGTARIEGALVVAGEAQGNGTLDLWFNSEMVKGAGEGNQWGGSNGGWRDF